MVRPGAMRTDSTIEIFIWHVKESVIQAPSKVAAHQRGSDNKCETEEDRDAKSEPRIPYAGECAPRENDKRGTEDH